MKKTGELLKQKREGVGLSLSEVALATKINPKILTAIENGDESNLPAKTFLKGFVRSYALFLKTDVDEVMNLFQDEMGITTITPHDAHRPAPEAPASSSRRRVGDESSSGLRTVAVVVIVMLIGLIIGVRELIEKYQKEKVVAGEVKVSPLVTPPVEPQPAPEKPASGEKAATEVAKADATKPESDKSDDPKPQEEKSQEDKPQEDKPQVQAEVTPSQGIPRALEAPKEAPKILPATAAKSANEAKPTETAQAKPSANEIKPAANEAKPVAAAPAPTAAAKPEATESAATDADAAKASPKPASVIKATTNEIILEALDKVEIRFNLDGQSKRVSLAPTQVHTVRADEPVTFDFSDGGAVNIILNGHERGPAGDLGKPKQVKIP